MGVIVLCTNVFNLLDLRPGRAIKVFVVLGAALTAASGEVRALWALGLFAAPALVAGAYDLRERAMLGDTGANLLGAVGGLVAGVDALRDRPGGRPRGARRDHPLRRAALNFRTCGTDPGLRYLDSLGRPS